MYKVNTWLHMVYDFIIFSSSRNKLDKFFGEFIAKLVRATLYFTPHWNDDFKKIIEQE